MHSNHWLYSSKTLVLASILCPPLGLVLVWMRPSMRLSRRILNSVYISALAFFYLYQFAGLRVERDGSGMMPMLSLNVLTTPSHVPACFSIAPVNVPRDC